MTPLPPAVRRAPAQTLQPLRDWLLAHPSPDEPVVTASGGEATGDGALPWPDYLPTIPAFWAALDATGWGGVDTRAYPEVVAGWRRDRADPTIHPGDLAGMDRVTLFNVLRGIQRGERFCDGAWAGALRAGLFHAGGCAVLALG